MKILPSLLLLLCSGTAIAESSLPRLELGASLVALRTADYRGSRSESSYLLPAPYLKYRGDRLRFDEGAQGVIVERPDLLLTLSGNLSLPVDDETPERDGMDDLEAIIEIGPSLNYRFYRIANSAWWLDLPLRFAYTINSDLEHIGSVFQPRLSWRQPATVLGEWKLRFNIGPLYADQANHDYFYSVESADATPQRPVYRADGGYSGLRSEFTWSKRFGRYWFGGFVRYDSLENAEIEDSPLVAETDAWVAGVSVAWVFHERW